MRTIWRTLLGVLIGLVALVVFMPWIVGWVLERNTQLLASDSPYYHVEIINYKRHWFNSTVTFKITPESDIPLKIQQLLFNPSSLPEGKDWIVVGHLQHG